jgi:hypothetical protein
MTTNTQILETTYLVQMNTTGWVYYSMHEYTTREAADQLAGEIFGGEMETRIVTVTKTVEAS